VLSGGFVRSLVPPGVWGKVVVAATAALAAGVVVSGGPSPAVDVRPADTDATVAPALSTPPVPDPDPTPQRRAVSPQPFSRPREAVSTTIADGTTSRAGTHTRGSDERGRESEQPVQPTETDDPEADGTSGSPAEGGLEGGSSSADGASTSAGDGSDDTGSGDPTGSNSGSDDGAAATSAQASDD
jgi:hypothetical protein